jgi:hypothetical protein
VRRVVAVCLALLPALASANGEVRLPPIFRTVMANGMRLVVAENRSCRWSR